ncbi:hypothetical protein QGP82_08015 [Leptothoe sp. LEGE 181152]|nr:hypothetical protein [Leptothoe sp. LEGE 181152]
MARRINQKCVACAQMSVAKSRQLHGESGDGCWVEKRCHRRLKCPHNFGGHYSIYFEALT